MARRILRRDWVGLGFLLLIFPQRAGSIPALATLKRGDLTMTFDIRASRGGQPLQGLPGPVSCLLRALQKPEYLAYREEQAKIKAARDAYKTPAWVSPEMDGGRYRKHKKYR